MSGSSCYFGPHPPQGRSGGAGVETALIPAWRNGRAHARVLPFPITAAALAGVFLVGCNPRYQTFTSYTPPTDVAGRQCLMQCSSTRQTCRQSGQTLIQQCRSQAQTEAHLETIRRAAAYSIELERYGNRGHGAPELPGPASPNYAQCDNEAAGVEQQCKDDYDLCYQNCGGQVAYTTHCVANCD